MINPKDAKGHVIFDCDGTLISSYEGILDCLGVLMESELGRAVSRDELRKKYYPQLDIMAHNFGMVVDTEKKQEKLMKKWSSICSERPHQYALFSGIENLLKQCERKNWALYVWTGRDRISTIEILTELKVISYFKEIRTASDGNPKPHPQGIEELVGEWDKKKIVLVGDSGADLRGAQNFGCGFIGALWCEHAEKNVLLNKKSARDVEECMNLLEQYFLKN